MAFSPAASAYLADLLTGLGTGFLSAPRGGPPLAGFGMGIQNANSLMAQRQQQADQGQERAFRAQQIQRQTEADARDAETRAAQKAAFSQLLPATANQAGMRPTGAGPGVSTSVPAAPVSPMLSGMTPDQIAFLRSYGQADAGGALTMIGTQAFKASTIPDLQEFDNKDGTAYKGYLKPDGSVVKVGGDYPRWQPPQPKGPSEMKQRALDAGLVPGTPEYRNFMLTGGTAAKVTYGDIVTGDAAKTMGFDPGGSYQKGSDGKWYVVQAPTKPTVTYQTLTGTALTAANPNLDPTKTWKIGSDGTAEVVDKPEKAATTFGDLITGDAAKAIGLDPAGTYQKDSTGKYVAVVAPKAAGTTYKTVSGDAAQALGLDGAKTWSIGSDGKATAIDKPTAEAGAPITGDDAKPLGLDPTGVYQKRPDGTFAVLVKPRAEGTFGGNALDAQDSNIILKGQADDAYRSTPEYAMAWNRQYQQPKLQTTQDPNDPSKQIIQAVIMPVPPTLKPPSGAAPTTPGPVAPQSGAASAASPAAQNAPQPGGPAMPTAVPIPGTASQKQLNAEQSLSKGFTERMQSADAIITKFGDAGRSVRQTIADNLPGGNFLISDERQQLDQAAQNFINAQLRRESGAAISQGELATARKQYIPQPGDSDVLLAQKAANRAEVIRGMQQNASPYPLPPPASSIDALKKKFNITPVAP